MKSFINGVSSHYSLKPGRLVYLDGSEQPRQSEKAEVKSETMPALTPEQQDAKLKEDAHASALKAIEAAKNDPAQLAKAYDAATKTQSALYSNKNKLAIDKGGSDLDKMLASMGISGKDAEGIKAQYALVFNADSLFGADVNFREDLDAASQKEANEEILPKLKGEFAKWQEGIFNPMIAQHQADITADDAAISRQEGLIRGAEGAEDFYDGKLEKAEDDLSGYLDKYDIDADGGSVTREQFRAVIVKMEGDELADDDIVDRKTDKAFAKYRELQGTVDAAKRDIEGNKQALARAEWAKGKAEQKKVRDGLSLRAAQDTLSAHLKDIADGTFKGKNGTLQEIALAKARADQENHAAEQAVMKQYAEAAQNKAAELLKGVVLSKLNSRKDANKQFIAESEAEIKGLKEAHDTKIAGIEAKGRAQLDKWGIDKGVPLYDTAKIKAGLSAHVNGSVSKNDKFSELVLDGEVDLKVNKGLKIVEKILAELNSAKAAKETDPQILGEKDFIDKANAQIRTFDEAVAQLNGAAKQQVEVRIASK